MILHSLSVPCEIVSDFTSWEKKLTWDQGVQLYDTRKLKIYKHYKPNLLVPFRNSSK